MAPVHERMMYLDSHGHTPRLVLAVESPPSDTRNAFVATAGRVRADGEHVSKPSYALRPGVTFRCGFEIRY